MNNTNPDRKTTRLTGGNIVLQPLCKKDTGAYYQGVKLSLAEMGRWLPFAHPGYDIKETRAWIKQRPGSWKAGDTYMFGIFDTHSGELIGGCGINVINEADKRANLGYWVRSDRTGRGIAVAAAKLLAKWGFDVLKLKRIEIVVAVENTRSLRVAEKAGAKREGVLRNRLNINDRMHDAVIYSLIPGEV